MAKESGSTYTRSMKSICSADHIVGFLRQPCHVAVLESASALGLWPVGMGACSWHRPGTAQCTDAFLPSVVCALCRPRAASLIWYLPTTWTSSAGSYQLSLWSRGQERLSVLRMILMRFCTTCLHGLTSNISSPLTVCLHVYLQSSGRLQLPKNAGCCHASRLKWFVLSPWVWGMGSLYLNCCPEVLTVPFEVNVKDQRMPWWVHMLLDGDSNGKLKDCFMTLDYCFCPIFVEQDWFRFYTLHFLNRNKHKAPRTAYKWSKNCNGQSRLRVHECHQWAPGREHPHQTSGGDFSAWESVCLYLGAK